MTPVYDFKFCIIIYCIFWWETYGTKTCGNTQWRKRVNTIFVIWYQFWILNYKTIIFIERFKHYFPISLLLTFTSIKVLVHVKKSAILKRKRKWIIFSIWKPIYWFQFMWAEINKKSFNLILIFYYHIKIFCFCLKTYFIVDRCQRWY